jgi:hypothetical protein
MAAAPEIKALAEQLAAAMPALDPAEQLVAINLTRLLADGEPVPTARLAQAVDLPEAQVADAPTASASSQTAPCLATS